MNEEKSFLLQKQVRDNSEDLQKELLDLKNWEQEMKRKEEELLNSHEQITVLPPIRSKKKKVIETSVPVPSTSKESVPERIKSYDYNAWDQFDVDAACRKMDDENESDEETEDVIGDTRIMHTEALKFKEKGNSFVQKKLYASAIDSYSQAIKIFPYDEVFYANRALCYLKQDNLYSAEADCTAALQINDTYVKAYHRRATARIELEDYEGAKQDIKQILSYEPANKEAKAMLLKVNKKLEKSQPSVISKSSGTSVEKKIGEKICNASKLREQVKIHKQQMEDMKKLKESTKLTITEINGDSDNEVIQEAEKSKEFAKSTKLTITEIPPEAEEKLPDWLPKLDENYSIVKPIDLPAHQRSKEAMRRITIKKVDFENNILSESRVENNSKDNEKIVVKNKVNVKDKQISEIDNSLKNMKKLKEKKKKNVIEKPKTPKIEVLDENPKKIENVEIITKKPEEKIKKRPIIEIISSEDVPPAPKTAVQFLTEWKRNKCLKFRFSYLTQIPPKTIPTLFKESMESNVFEEIIIVLKEEFIPHKKNIFDYLEQLSNVQRFRTLIMFVERKTKEALKELFEHCKRVENKSDEEIDKLREKYEL